MVKETFSSSEVVTAHMSTLGADVVGSFFLCIFSFHSDLWRGGGHYAKLHNNPSIGHSVL